MSSARLIVQSLLFHWRLNLAVGLGVMAGTAVLAGALLVGDSVHYSLTRLTLDRLGRIDSALVSDRFFRVALADELAAKAEFQRHFREAVPLVIVNGSVAHPDRDTRAGRVTLVGCDERFWRLRTTGPSASPGAREVALNQPLADELGAKVGDEVLVRFRLVTEVPADSPLGKKSETVESRRLTINAIIPAEGFGRFSLRPNQALPRNAYVALETLQQELNQPDRANALLIAAAEFSAPTTPEADAVLRDALHPTLEDYGLKLEEITRGDEHYFQLSSRRMLLEPRVGQAARAAFQGLTIQPVLTYLANSLTLIPRIVGQEEPRPSKVIPYSTIAALNFVKEPPLGPILTTDGNALGSLVNTEIALNAWAAEDLGARVADQIAVTYFEPESTHGEILEQTVTLRLKAIVEMQGPAIDPKLTPALPGVTDQLEISDWNPPFPFDSNRVREQDEEYWDEYKAAPKAFVTLETGRALWSNRFGRTTSIRIAPQPGMTVETLAQRLKLDPAQLGFVFQPVKRQGLAAAKGTTPFNLLFLGFSFYIMAAAVMLVALLFRLGIDRRAREIGIMQAAGFRRRKISGVLLAEGVLVAGLGGLAGVAAGVGYAWLMITGLTTWWVQAITTPFLQLHMTPLSLALGYAGGVLVSLVAIWWALWQMRHVQVRRLLTNRTDDPGTSAAGRAVHWLHGTAWSALILAVAVGMFASTLGGEAQAGAFFGAGALALIAGLTFLWLSLRSGGTGPLVTSSRFALTRLAIRNGARHPGRSTLTIGLVAAASFLIVAISAFRQDPSQTASVLNSGNGGFALVAESDQPIYQDLNSPAGRTELGFSRDDDQTLQSAQAIALRVQPGEDASCLNLYQTAQPRVLGVTQAMFQHGGFAWAATAAKDDVQRQNPWLLLNQDLGRTANGEPIVPVVIDLNTAMYSLHLWQGIGSRLEIDAQRGQKLHLQVVGLLQNSLFQGNLLIGEQPFLRNFPEVSGYRYFLVQAAPQQSKLVEQALERTLGDYGFDARDTRAVLAEFLAVQNTYLSTFQSLGGLGLLLGTFGLATVQLRNVLERRGDLALLRAIGFRRRMLAAMVMLENIALLVGGLAIGVAAAMIAILPHLTGGGATIPWLSLAGTLTLVLVVGLLAGLAAVRATLTTPLLPALRGD